MPAIYRFAHQVQPEEIDRLGHVNNLAYLRWLQDAAVAHSAAQGWPGSRYQEAGEGWVVRSHFIEYLKPAFVDEQIEVVTWVANLGKVQSLRKYKIVRVEPEETEPTLLATAETNWVFVGYERGFPRRIPPEVRNSFEIVTEADEP